MTTAEDQSELPGEPDGFDRLWTPHRMAYVVGGANKPTHDEPGDDCPFCRVPGLSDEEALIVARGEHVFAVLNLYPYNSGHVLICPYRHVADYTELTPAETLGVAEFTQRAMRAIRAEYSPHGFNLGMNQGAAAGAGIAAHLHAHVVPRWGGDANFLPIVAQTKALPEILSDTRDRLARAWGEVS